MRCCKLYSSTMKKTSTSTHRQRYHLPPAFECQDCKKTFSENSSLTRHLLSHTHTPCLMCNKNLNQTNIRRHIKKVHNNLLSGTFKVSLCLLCLEAECAGACNGSRGPKRLRLSEFVQISEFFSNYITDICQTSE